MAQLSEKTEGAIVGTASACTAISVGVLTQPIPTEIKAVISSVSGLTAAALYAFWYGFVNKKPQTPTQ